MSIPALGTWTIDDAVSVNLPNVSDAERDIIRDLLRVWTNRRPRNLKRSLYYDAEQAFKDLGIALPPQLKSARFYLGWPAMAVRKLAHRSIVRGLRLPGSDDPFELGETLTRNRFSLEFGEAITSAYKHGCSFVTVARGDVSAGEPPVQIQPHSAESSAAIWDRRRRQVKYGLTVSEMDGDSPLSLVVYLPDFVLRCERPKGGNWSVERIENPVGRAQIGRAHV